MAATSAAGFVARRASKLAKPAAMAAGAWLVKRFGDKVADEGFSRSTASFNQRRKTKTYLVLAQDLARANMWKYTERTVVGHRHRFLVWSLDKRPMAAFPPIDDATTP